MKAYKGMDKNMQCRGYQFEVGKTYKQEGLIKICDSGFHACENALDVLHHYRWCDGNRFFEVKCDGDISTESGGDSKLACSQLEVCAEIEFSQLFKAGMKSIFERVGALESTSSTGAASGSCSTGAASGRYSTGAASGNYSTGAASGHCSTGAASGYCSTGAASGHCSTGAASGNHSTGAASGDYSTGAASGRCSIGAASGDYSTGAASGRYSTGAASGNYSTGAASGNYSTATAEGADSIAVANGRKARASAALGSYIVLTEYDDVGHIRFCKLHKVDGKVIKPNTLYTLIDGKFTEAE